MKTALLAALAMPAIIVALPAAADAQGARPAPLAVTMTNRGFAPARLTMRSGGSYVLRLRNPSDRAHTFSAKEFFKLARVAPQDSAWVSNNEVVLKPGERAAVRIVAPTTPGAVYYVRSTRIQDAATSYKARIYVR